MERYFIFLKYKGTRYHGWQKQPNAITIQEILEEKLEILLREKVETTGAGRTDTGVHATEFAAHFDSANIFLKDKEQFLFKINCLLPFDISVYNIAQVKPGSHARFDAVSRTYEYHITLNKNPFVTEYAFYYPWKLNLQRMNEACNVLFEYSDFTSFSKLHTDVKTNNCSIKLAQWKAVDDQLIFTISADRFLRNMVRAIVGTMIDIGKEKLLLTDFKDIIERKNRNFAGVSVPAHGLYLIEIEYPSLIFD